MGLDKMTPTHEAMATIRKTINDLELYYASLAATLPQAKKEKKIEPGKRKIVHPITGKARYY